jgi:hypothetical protein
MAINEGCIYEQNKSSLISGNARYHAVQNLLCPRLLSNTVSIKNKALQFYMFCIGAKLGLLH